MNGFTVAGNSESLPCVQWFRFSEDIHFTTANSKQYKNAQMFLSHIIKGDEA